MAQEIKLLKKVGKYTDTKDGKEKSFTNFFVKCGSEAIPVEVKFFGGDDGKDPRYSSRKAVMSAFAEEMPEKSKTAAETSSN